MGTRSDSTESLESDENCDISFLFEKFSENNGQIITEKHSLSNEVMIPIPSHNAKNSEEVHDIPSPHNIPCSDEDGLNNILVSDCEDLKKYKSLSSLYFCKSEEAEQKYKELEKKSKETRDNLNKITLERDEAVREKENMVIKYAIGEKKLLAESQLREKAEKKCHELNKEREFLQHKLKIMMAEKLRICKMFDNKVHELKNLESEYDKLKSDKSILENELKWCQNNLKNEIDIHKESQKTIEGFKRQVHEFTEQMEQVKKNAQESIRSFKFSEENQAFILEQKCKEQQASLILLKHERDDRENQLKLTENTLEKLQSKHRSMLQENNGLSLKVQELERHRLESEHKLRELRGCADQQLQDAADLQMKMSQLEQCKLQLKNEKEQLEACSDQVKILKSRNSELEGDMEGCRKRESELLLFTQQLTDKNVRLQSEFTTLETKVQQLTSEQTLIKRSSKEYETKAAMLLGQLSEQKQKYLDEINSLKKMLNEEIRKNSKLKQEIFDQKGETSIIKRKHDLTLKEMYKELQRCRKENKSDECGSTRKSSNCSSSSLISHVSTIEKRSEGYPEDHVKVIQPDAEIDKQTLIEHIVKLQRISARKSEKIDFLEEHINTLIAELQKKSKLLQIYMLREQTGTLTSDKMDNTKADLAKLNGIMASMYSSRVVDENLTLELSLDINRKLQAVLEDALLKNITLKKSVDTLGEEIDRLNKLLNC